MAFNLTSRLLRCKKDCKKILTCYLATQVNTKFKTYNQIPGPKATPFVGNLFNLKQFGGELDIEDYGKFTIKLQEKYGDIVKWNIFGEKECFVFTPKHVKEIFKADGTSPKRMTLEALTMLQKRLKINSTLANSNGERWRTLRTAINPILVRPKTILSYLPNHNTVSDEFIQLLNREFGQSDGFIIENFEKKLKLLALEYISEIAFNKRINCLDEARTDPVIIKLVESINDITPLLAKLLFTPAILWKYYETKDLKKFYEVGEFLFKKTTEFIYEAKEDLEKIDQSDPNRRKSVLSEFLERKDKYGLSMEDVVSTMIDLVLGGIDTTSITLHYVLYELGTHKDIQNKLYQEISSYLKPGEELTEEKLDKMRYLKNIIKECFRFHSIAPGNSRILQQDLLLDGYLIPEGTRMTMGSMYITQSERFFKNPSKFDPSRWDREEDMIDPYASLPFGFGPRMCIGRRTAEQEIYIATLKLVQNYELEYIGEKPGYKVSLFATPDRPLNLKFTKRNHLI